MPDTRKATIIRLIGLTWNRTLVEPDLAKRAQLLNCFYSLTHLVTKRSI